MSNFLAFVSETSDIALDSDIVKEASNCLDEFTDAFNALDLAGMDARLHFPHVMISETETLIWETSGQHPVDFFSRLQGTGWKSTRYESKVPVLASMNKVHFLVTYTRRAVSGEERSRHINLWIVVKRNNVWGISLRSY
ncbi:hypothetical protein G7047_06355 [Diaphorobacter sp. HDW4A]|uniref:hypothetical protein n=1 Tax=Diaphorobacter sp. HDW4A TaxID=2714924 RepID=UPI001407DB4D|nr:hypothetical protein [Diaphorobacter sp. HDW4A]QIL79566.1 hypothetical protein G7047_06355 [Diaphorobacter sp. HDW4A]